MTTHRFEKLGTALAAATLAASVLMTGTAAAETPDRDQPASSRFQFAPVVFPMETRFTQLLGINDHRVIAGYHGDENTEQTPNKGFTLELPNTFTDEIFHNSAQTQWSASTTARTRSASTSTRPATLTGSSKKTAKTRSA